MDLVKLSNIAAYWRRNANYGGGRIVNAIMSFRKFKLFMKYAHFCDEDEAKRTGVKDPNSDNYRKLYKIEQFIDAIFERFTECHQPDQRLALDESMHRFLGRWECRQAIPGKPTPKGQKWYMLSESGTGYILSAHVFAKHNNVPMARELGSTNATILHLLNSGQNGGYLNQGYHVYMDNFYTGVGILELLRQNDTYCCGTVVNKFGVPKDIIGKQLDCVKDLPQSGYLYRHTDTMTCVTWFDNKPVSVLSTLPHLSEGSVPCFRRRKKFGISYMSSAEKPVLVDNYNQFMGAVDLSDQLMSYNHRHYKAYKYYKAMMHRMIRMVIVNTYVLKNRTFLHHAKRNYQVKTCMENIIDGIKVIHPYQGIKNDAIRSTKAPGAISIPDARKFADPSYHFAAPLATVNFWRGRPFGTGRALCVMCRTGRSQYYCKSDECMVALHIECFEQFHLALNDLEAGTVDSDVDSDPDFMEALDESDGEFRDDL